MDPARFAKDAGMKGRDERWVMVLETGEPAEE